MRVAVEQESNHSLTDGAYDAIRRAIIACELAPGEHVSESQLASRFGSGRAAVRVALTRLRHEQLVYSIPRQGYAVAPITLKRALDLFGTRLIIEPAAARLAAGRADDEIITHLERLNQDCDLPVDCVDSAELRRANTAFHMAVARASGNERLADMVGVVLDDLERVLYLPQLANVHERINASVPEHQRIIEALRARDTRAAEQAAHDHIVPNQQFVIEGLIASPQLRSINLVSS